MIQSFLLAIIRAYQRVISPWTPASCRFQPTCSQYAHVAIERYGAARGGWLALKRLGRCRPFGGQGWDPVPECTHAPGRPGDPGIREEAA